MADSLKLQRLIEIVMILLNRETVVASELAERFAVSKRTIYRDIYALSSAGIPIYTLTGKGGGVALMEEFTIDKTFLSPSEQDGLLMALKILSGIGYPEAITIIDKLGSIFTSQQTDSWMEVYFDKDDCEQEKFNRIKSAIIDCRIITFNYVNGRGENRHRTAEPLKLIYTKNNWFLIALCYSRYVNVMFKLTRITDVEITEQKFEKRRLPKYDYQTTKSNPAILKLKCDPQVLSRLLDTFSSDEISENEDGTYGLELELYDEQWANSFILSLGPYAEVIEPSHLRETIKNDAKKILAKY